VVGRRRPALEIPAFDSNIASVVSETTVKPSAFTSALASGRVQARTPSTHPPTTGRSTPAGDNEDVGRYVREPAIGLHASAVAGLHRRHVTDRHDRGVRRPHKRPGRPDRFVGTYSVEVVEPHETEDIGVLAFGFTPML